MPALGYLLGSQFESMITQIDTGSPCASRDHWIKHDQRIQGGRRGRGQRELDVKTMLALAVATSIDALAVGVTFAFLHVISSGR